MKMRKKADLPMKLCVVCGLPFSWRRKWARDWEQVKYCSDRCRQSGSRQTPDSESAAVTTAIGVPKPMRPMAKRRP